MKVFSHWMILFIRKYNSIMNIQDFKCKHCDKCAFVSKTEAKENRKGFFDVLQKVNKQMKGLDYPGFTNKLVGSSKRNMIYIKSKNDNDFDHDIQVEYNSTKKPISNKLKDLRNDFAKALMDNFPKEEGVGWNVEQSTRVITIKKYKKSNGARIASFDLALIDAKNNRIHVLDKSNNIDEAIWNEMGNVKDAYKKAGNIDLNTLKQAYLNRKHEYKDKSKDNKDYRSSSEIFVETVNNIA